MYQPAKALSSRKCLCYHGVTCLNLQKYSSAANVSTITALHVSTCKSTLPPQMSVSSRHYMYQPAKALFSRKCLCHLGLTCINLQKHSPAASISVISASHVSTCKSTLQPQMSLPSRHYMYQPAKALFSRKCLYQINPPNIYSPLTSLSLPHHHLQLSCCSFSRTLHSLLTSPTHQASIPVHAPQTFQTTTQTISLPC